jgi:selenocysteine lyase/cysteine desulfurase
MTGTRHLSTLDIINEFPGVCGSISFETPRAEEITSALSKRGIQVWGRDGRVRVSPHLYNTDADIDALLAHLPALVTSGVDR